MSSAALAKPDEQTEIMERVLLVGDLAKLGAQERVSYYMATCKSLGLNPYTRPFEYIVLNGKMTLYARKDCTDQLRHIHRISLRIISRDRMEDAYVVTASATTADGRTDESIGAVPLAAGIKGENLANALMKCETKAKRRVTLSICGLNFPDESEVDSIPGAQRVTVTDDGEIVPPPKSIARPAPPPAPLDDAAQDAIDALVERIANANNADDLSVASKEAGRLRSKVPAAVFAHLKALWEKRKEWIAGEEVQS